MKSMEVLEKRFLKAAAQLAPERRPVFNLETILFGQQRAFVRDSSPYATGVCGRRSGKSYGVGSWLLEGPLQNPKAPSLYMTLTRESAKRILWPTLLELNRKHRLGFEPNEADLILKRAGRGSVYLVGANNRAEIEKVRGVGWGRVAIDEAQAFPAFLEELIDDVLDPSLMDHGGLLRVIGTPSPVPTGYFHEIASSEKWKHHAWTPFDNPYVKATEQLAKAMERRGVTEDDPSIQREFFGKWAYDPSTLVFKWAAKNAQEPPTNLTDYVIGVDLGFDDADAIAVLGWNSASPNLYLVEEHVTNKQTVTQLGAKLTALQAQYQPHDTVCDTGGLGKKIAAEVEVRTGITLSPAEKERKFEHIELLNDALRSGRFFARGDSRFSQDVLLIEWDRDKSHGDHLVISDRFHSDIADAVLYAYRRAQHWLYQEPPPVKPPGMPGDEEHIQVLEQELRDRKRERQDLEDWGYAQ